MNNVISEYQDLMLEDIKYHLLGRRAQFTSVFINLTHDFNKSVGVRNHNAFLGNGIWFVGNKRWDKRGAVGTYHYEDIHYAANWETFLEERPDGPIIAVENTGGPNQVYLGEFDLPFNSIFVYGEEGNGLPDYVLDCADYVLAIPQWGSVRSLNVSVASGIIMFEYRRQFSLPF